MRLNGKALTRSTIGVVWLVVALTLAAEISAPFKALLTQFASHHWIGKSIISVVAFVLLYVIFRNSDESKGIWGSVLFALGSVVVGGLLIFTFYLWHFISG